MNFLNPSSLVILLLLPIFVVFFVWRNRLAQMRLNRLGALPLSQYYRRSALIRKQTWWMLAVTFLVIALARPAWGEEVIVVESHGASVMIVLDVSRSMDALDLIPSRLERAKLMLNDLLDGLTGSEIGLILFAGSPFVRFPLTLDVMSASTFLNAVSSDVISHQGTNIEAALLLAVDSFRNVNYAQRTIILLSDGEDHEGDVIAAAEFAAEKNIIVHTIGLGNAAGGSPVPVKDTDGKQDGYQVDHEGNIVLSHLDEAALQEIAMRTGGTYQLATSGGGEITNLINIINSSQAENLRPRIQSRASEHFGIFVALALITLSLEAFLFEVRWKKL